MIIFQEKLGFLRIYGIIVNQAFEERICPAAPEHGNFALEGEHLCHDFLRGHAVLKIRLLHGDHLVRVFYNRARDGEICCRQLIIVVLVYVHAPICLIIAKAILCPIRLALGHKVRSPGVPIGINAALVQIIELACKFPHKHIHLCLVIGNPHGVNIIANHRRLARQRLPQLCGKRLIQLELISLCLRVIRKPGIVVFRIMDGNHAFRRHGHTVDVCNVGIGNGNDVPTPAWLQRQHLPLESLAVIAVADRKQRFEPPLEIRTGRAERHIGIRPIQVVQPFGIRLVNFLVPRHIFEGIVFKIVHQCMAIDLYLIVGGSCIDIRMDAVGYLRLFHLHAYPLGQLIDQQRALVAQFIGVGPLQLNDIDLLVQQGNLLRNAVDILYLGSDFLIEVVLDLGKACVHACKKACKILALADKSLPGIRAFGRTPQRL